MATYIADTHALYWYLQMPTKLGPGADAVFRLAEIGDADIVVPAIVVAEIYYLTKKRGQSLLPYILLKDLDKATGFVFSELGRGQLIGLENLNIEEMHDRLIAAEALTRTATVITKDRDLQQSNDVNTVW